jgi:hypothetical protein
MHRPAAAAVAAAQPFPAARRRQEITEKQDHMQPKCIYGYEMMALCPVLLWQPAGGLHDTSARDMAHLWPSMPRRQVWRLLDD